MKLDALDHPKTLEFAAQLNIPRVTAIGHLELLWAFTGKQAPQGNIGKWPDGAIARACDWMGEPKLFLQSLLQSRLIDTDEVHRYVIHDWQDHAPRWVKAKLAQLKLPFISKARTVVATAVGDNDKYVGPTADTTGATVTPSTSSAPSSSLVKCSEGKGRLTERVRVREGPAGRERKVSEPEPEPTGNDKDPRAGPFDPAADSAAFHRAKAAYPKFAGRQDWIQAEHYCHNLLDAGETWESLLAAVERYAKHIRAKGSEGTQFVLSPGKFFSAADQPWKQPWEIPAEPQRRGSTGSATRIRTAEEIEDEAMERHIRGGLTDEEIHRELDECVSIERIRLKRREVQCVEH